MVPSSQEVDSSQQYSTFIFTQQYNREYLPLLMAIQLGQWSGCLRKIGLGFGLAVDEVGTGLKSDMIYQEIYHTRYVQNTNIKALTSFVGE